MQYTIYIYIYRERERKREREREIGHGDRDRDRVRDNDRDRDPRVYTRAGWAYWAPHRGGCEEAEALVGLRAELLGADDVGHLRQLLISARVRYWETDNYHEM